MITGYRNTLINPGFEFWDYGNGPFSASGYTASRWKLLLTGAPTVAVSKGTNDASAATPKWYRGRPNLQVAVTAYNATSDSILIRQYQEQGERFGEQNTILSGVATGPAGAHFYVGIDGQYYRIDTEGNDGGGVPIPTHFIFATTIGPQSNEYVAVDIFTRPSANGTYTVAFAQFEYSEAASAPSSFELRSVGAERMLLNRYVCPVGYGHFGFGDGTTGYLTSFRFPVEMRDVPTFVPRVAAGATINLISSGGVVTAATPVYTATLMNKFGARMKIAGFSATTSAPYMLSSDVGLFHADY